MFRPLIRRNGRRIRPDKVFERKALPRCGAKVSQTGNLCRPICREIVGIWIVIAGRERLLLMHNNRPMRPGCRLWAG